MMLSEEALELRFVHTIAMCPDQRCPWLTFQCVDAAVMYIATLRTYYLSLLNVICFSIAALLRYETLDMHNQK